MRLWWGTKSSHCPSQALQPHGIILRVKWMHHSIVRNKNRLNGNVFLVPEILGSRSLMSLVWLTKLGLAIQLVEVIRKSGFFLIRDGHLPL